MEFLDEYESRPRLLFQSKSLPQSSNDADDHSSSVHKSTFSIFISVSLSILIFILAILYFNLEPIKSLLIWLSCSLLVGPFAPPSLTAGDIRVGVGPPLEEIPETPVETSEKVYRKSVKSSRKQGFGDTGVKFELVNVNGSIGLGKNEVRENGPSGNVEIGEEREWSEEDEELLRKLMVKHPVGKPGRWEAIAEGFKGKHRVESVIKKAKEMPEKKTSDEDSYKKFLRNRKPVDKRVLDEAGNDKATGTGIKDGNLDEERKESGWAAREDMALLSALKAFPKDVPMRWEKIAAALPGKTKASCMKRVAELKRDFRSSKASSGEAS